MRVCVRVFCVFAGRAPASSGPISDSGVLSRLHFFSIRSPGTSCHLILKPNTSFLSPPPTFPHPRYEIRDETTDQVAVRANRGRQSFVLDKGSSSLQGSPSPADAASPSEARRAEGRISQIPDTSSGTAAKDPTGPSSGRGEGSAQSSGGYDCDLRVCHSPSGVFPSNSA